MIWKGCLLFLFALAVLAGGSKDDPEQLTLPKPRVVITGMSGAGKSTLANVLMGEDPMCPNCMFPVCPGTDSCTKETSFAAGHWLGDGQYFTVVDTPGFNDSDGEDEQNIENMMDILNNVIESASTILLVFKGNEDRFGDGLVQMVKQLTMLFGEGMWDHVIIGVTFWAYDQDSINDREQMCTDYPDFCRDEEHYLAEMNRQLQEKINLKRNLTAVFIDSYAKKGSNNEDPLQQQYFDQETQKLLDFMLSKGDFMFRTINDVLEENNNLHEENECLNGIIDNELEGIRNDMREIENDDIMMTQHIAYNKHLISVAEEDINSNKASISNVNSDLSNKLETLEQQLQELTNTVNNLVPLVPPVGSIIAWRGYGFTGLAIPAGWQLCDGSVITEGPMAGKYTEDLNGQGRFLRGGVSSEAGRLQDDALQTHLHSVSDPGHTHSDKGHDHSFSYTGARDQDGDNANDRTQAHKYEMGSRTSSGKADITVDQAGVSVGEPSSGRIDGETRPINMAVEWIIRIY